MSRLFLKNNPKRCCESMFGYLKDYSKVDHNKTYWVL